VVRRFDFALTILRLSVWEFHWAMNAEVSTALVLAGWLKNVILQLE
jgi:hypothetical protein